MKNYQTLRVTTSHYMMLFSRVILIGTLYFLAKTNPDWTQEFRILEEQKMFLYVLSGMSVLMLILAFVLGPKSPSQEIDYGQTPARKKAPDLITQTILGMTLTEAAGIFGMTLAFLNRSVNLVYPFMAISVVAQFMIFRRYRQNSEAQS